MKIDRMTLERCLEAQEYRHVGAFEDLFQLAREAGPWVQTYTGKAYPLLAPTTEDICIADIAHALAGVIRFNGHTKRNEHGRCYSVGQHSVMASRIVDPAFAFEALMHDAAEAYVGDMTRPLRLCLPDFDLIERITWAAIARKFGLPRELSAEVKHADLVMLVTEKRDLCSKPPRPWAHGGPEPLAERIRIWAPGITERAFLHYFHESGRTA